MAREKVRVRLKFFAHLADRYGVREDAGEVSSELAEALVELNQVLSPKLGGDIGSYYAVLVNGRNYHGYPEGTKLKDGDALAFVPIAGGGTGAKGTLRNELRRGVDV